jgi:xylan 1,4-beta-xylosidase
MRDVTLSHRQQWSLAVLVAGAAIALTGCDATLRDGRSDAALRQRTVTVTAADRVGSCYNFWSVGNFNKPHAVLEAEAVRTHREAAPFVTELNLVYLLGGRYRGVNEWFLGLAEDGTPRTDFSGMIDQLRAAQAAGYGVRVVLDKVPYGLSDPPRENYYGNTAPPADGRVWGLYVEAAVRAMVEAFGRETVLRWPFRVGTEPDLNPAHWAGTREEYFAYYDHTVAAVRRVLPEAVVGPGNILNPNWHRDAQGARRRWGLDIIDHAATGINAATGQVGSPMDIFSCSWYPRVGWPLERFDEAMGAMRERLDRHERFRTVPIEVGEFAVLGDGRGRHLYAGDTTEWSAGFYAALADRVYALDVRKLYEWDHATLGVLHPKGRVIEMLAGMVGGDRLRVTSAGGSDAVVGAVACRQGDDLHVLLYHHRSERAAGPAETVRLVVEDPRMTDGATWGLSQWLLDREHGVWAYRYEADATAAGLKPLPNAGLYEGAVLRLYGEPGVPVFRSNQAAYEALSRPLQEADNQPVAVGDGRWTVTVEMPCHSVRLLRLKPSR